MTTAFRFPFVAYLHPRGVTVWGRMPASKAGRVTIEHRVNGVWRRAKGSSADRYGIFAATIRIETTAEDLFRARSAGAISVPFSLVQPPGQHFNAFGSPA